MDIQEGLEALEVQQLLEEIERLRSIIKEGGIGTRFLKVTNLTPNYVSLYHPSGEDEKHRTLAPYEAKLLDPAFADSEYVVAARDRGEIEFCPADRLEDDGRLEALSEKYRLSDHRLEAAALQFLLFPGDSLDQRTDRGHTGGNEPDVQVMAQILWNLIHVIPRVGGPGGRIDVDYLKYQHLTFLENVLTRERLWRNRPGIIEPLERRISEIKAMDNRGLVHGKEIPRRAGPTL